MKKRRKVAVECQGRRSENRTPFRIRRSRHDRFNEVDAAWRDLNHRKSSVKERFSYSLVTVSSQVVSTAATEEGSPQFVAVV